MTLLQGVFLGIVNALGGLARIVTPIWSKYSYLCCILINTWYSMPRDEDKVVFIFRLLARFEVKTHRGSAEL